jgi:hypothetical protein
MRTQITARLVALIILGLLNAVVYERLTYSEHARGKTVFMAAQERRFDTFYADPHMIPFLRLVGSALLMSAVIVGVYELLAFAIRALIARFQVDERAQPRT